MGQKDENKNLINMYSKFCILFLFPDGTLALSRTKPQKPTLAEKTAGSAFGKG
jgi:hypothetical protein